MVACFKVSSELFPSVSENSVKSCRIVSVFRAAMKMSNIDHCFDNMFTNPKDSEGVSRTELVLPQHTQAHIEQMVKPTSIIM